jgi:uncharacterized repeat protein (TIGR01451 family)
MISSRLRKIAALTVLVVLQWVYPAYPLHAAVAPPGTLVWTALAPEATGLHIPYKSSEMTVPWLGPPIDIDGDKDMDITWYSHHGGFTYVWLGMGDGTFGFDSAGRTRWPFMSRDPIWWDFTGDGYLDGISAESKPDAVLHKNDGRGFFINTGLQFNGRFADANGDGYHDEGIAGGGIVGTISPPIKNWNQGMPTALTFTPVWNFNQVPGWPPEVPKGTSGVAVGWGPVQSVDLDGDFKSEWIVHLYGNTVDWDPAKGRVNYTFVLKRDPAAPGITGWQDVTAQIGLPTGPDHSYYPEDVDMDGDLDILDLRGGQWFVNNGSGQFTASPNRIFADPLVTGKYFWDDDGELEIWDFDNNGYRDIMMNTEHYTRSGFFMNMGGGVFQPGVRTPMPSNSRRNIRPADLDGDHDIDMVYVSNATSTKPEKFTLYRNEGAANGITVRFKSQLGNQSWLGASLWIYEAGKMGDKSALVGHMQGFMPKSVNRANVLDPFLHAGIGTRSSVDVRVRYPSGIIREARNVPAKSTILLEEVPQTPKANVTISSRASHYYIQTDGSIEYTLRWKNEGNAAATNVLVSAPLPNGTRFDRMLTPGCTFGSNKITCQVTRLAPAESGSVTYLVKAL